MTRIQKRIDSFLYDTGGYSTQRIAAHDGEGLYRTEHTPVVSRFCHFVTNPGHVSDVSRVRGRRRRGVYHAYSASRSRADRVRELQ